mgnify:CR=1 FL=1
MSKNRTNPFKTYCIASLFTMTAMFSYPTQAIGIPVVDGLNFKQQISKYVQTAKEYITEGQRWVQTSLYWKQQIKAMQSGGLSSIVAVIGAEVIESYLQNNNEPATNTELEKAYGTEFGDCKLPQAATEGKYSLIKINDTLFAKNYNAKDDAEKTLAQINFELCMQARRRPLEIIEQIKKLQQSVLTRSKQIEKLLGELGMQTNDPTPAERQNQDTANQDRVNATQTTLTDANNNANTAQKNYMEGVNNNASKEELAALEGKLNNAQTLLSAANIEFGDAAATAESGGAGAPSQAKLIKTQLQINAVQAKINADKTLIDLLLAEQQQLERVAKNRTQENAKRLLFGNPKMARKSDGAVSTGISAWVTPPPKP